MNIPTDTKLYEKIKKETKKRFQVWPSAYASGFLIREYKRRGGTFRKSSKKSKKMRKSSKKSKKVRKSLTRLSSSKKSRRKSGLSRWFAEKWIDACKYPKIVSCGRKSGGYKNKKKYPYCRPLYRISPSTPKTVKEISKRELKKRCSRKKSNPKARIL